MHKRAFTLIELLVVIAIIAILAAILFPVFAQAKQAAKGAASLSNAKQQGLAYFMYEGDVDDKCPMSVSWEADAPITVGGCGVTLSSMTTMPYMKNGDILMDPLTTPEPIPNGWPKPLWQSIFPQYGYNYTVWSPVFGGSNSCTTPWIAQTLSSTGVNRVADVPILVSKPNSDEESGWGVLWWYGAGSIVSSNITDAPDCNDIPQWCFGNWGEGTNWDLAILSGATSAAGKYTGGNSRRRANEHVIIFGDGHAKVLSPGQLAIGTNFIDSPTWPSGSLVINNPLIYRWNQQ